MDFRFIIMIMAGLFMANSAAASDSTDEDFIPEGWEATGEVKSCVISYRIRDTDVLDDNNILFHMNGRKSYINHLNHSCFGLGFEQAFAYRISTSRLCSVDIIQVVSSTGGGGGSCGLGDFVGIRPVSQEAINSAR